MSRHRIRTAVAAGLLGLAAAAQAEPQGGSPVPKADAPAVHISMFGVGLSTVNLDRAVRFYREGLGLSEVRRFQTAEVDQVIMGFGPDSSPHLFLVQRRAGKNTALSGDHQDKIILQVDDAARLSARLKAAGYAPGEIEEKSAHGVKLFWVSDPDGHRFEVTERTTRSH